LPEAKLFLVLPEAKLFLVLPEAKLFLGFAYINFNSGF
jgi:hypothetical protein